MALSKASCTGRGLIPAIGGHVHRMFDEGEDDLFSLSLDDVMDDRPWTADELMGGGGARPSSPNPALAPEPVSAPTPAQSPVSTPAPTPHPLGAHARSPPCKRPVRDGGISRSSDAGQIGRQHRYVQRPAVACSCGTQASDRKARRAVAHQVAYDSWATADLDETSTGMPALDVPVNPLFCRQHERRGL